MKKINLNIYPLEINKIKALEEAFNKLLEILAKEGIIEIEEDNNELHKDSMD